MKRSILYAGLAVLLFAESAGAQRLLTLEESLRLALENNAGIMNSRLEAEAAERIRLAAATRYFPDISAGGLYFDASRALFELRTPGGDLPVYDGNPANLLHPASFAYFPGGETSLLGKGQVGYLDIIQPLYAGGRIVNGSRLAALGRDAARDRSRMTRDEILLATSELFYRTLSLDEKRATLRSYETLLDRLAEEVGTALAAGLVMRNDLLKVNLKRSEVRLNRSRLENGHKLAAMSLCQQIGIPRDSTLVLAGDWSSAGAPQSCYVDPQSVLKQRQEYALLEKSVRAAKLQTALKRGELLPQAGIGARTMVVKLDEGPRRTLGLVYGSLSIPLSGWIGGSAELEERRLREKIAENELRNNAELLLLEMEQAWQEVTDGWKRVLLSEEAVAQAEENLRVNEESRRNGLTALSDLLEAQALLQKSRDELTEARSDYCIKKCRYLRVTGRSAASL
ncbi:MAG TPA: TolC family protein [bacterium]|nr:TolC family protein [bacterium]HOZ22409.1 TolC family protein [bacterium]